MTTQNRSKKTLTEQLVEAEARVETIKQRIAAEHTFIMIALNTLSRPNAILDLPERRSAGH